MKQICYECGRELMRCECAEHMRRPGHRASAEDGMMFVEKHPQEMLVYMLQSNQLSDILQAVRKNDPDEFQHMACCAAEVFADNFGLETMG